MILRDDLSPAGIRRAGLFLFQACAASKSNCNLQAYSTTPKRQFCSPARSQNHQISPWISCVYHQNNAAELDKIIINKLLYLRLLKILTKLSDPNIILIARDRPLRRFVISVKLRPAVARAVEREWKYRYGNLHV